MVHPLCVRPGCEFPCSGKLVYWPARGVPVDIPSHGNPRLLALVFLYVALSHQLACPLLSAVLDTQKVPYERDFLFGRPEPLDIWIVAVALPGPRQALPRPRERLSVFPTTPRDIYWAMWAECNDYAADQHDSPFPSVTSRYFVFGSLWPLKSRL